MDQVSVGIMPEELDKSGMSEAINAEPVRMCVICRRRYAKSALTRYVVSALGDMVIDIAKTAPGRGIYLCPDPHCGAKFVKYRPGVKRRGKKHA